MKKILFISPAFANEGVVNKYDRRYIDSWSKDCCFTVATKKFCNKDKYPYEFLLSSHFFSHTIQILLGRYLNGREIVVPDSNVLTIKPFLLRKCRQYLKTHKVDVIHTVSFPCSSHLIGYELKKEFGLPWIAHFYDPWYDNPLRNIPDSKREKDAQMEALVAEYADAIIHSNNVIKECWNERYGESLRGKIYIIPFGYSDEQVKAFAPFSGTLPQTDKIVMSYIGTCAGERNFQSLIKAVDLLKLEMPCCGDKLEIRLLGNLLDRDKILIDRLRLWDVFTYVGRKPQSELQKYYKESDIFLVIDSSQDKNVFFPSKLVDYFYYQRPILGISPKIGVTNQFLTESANFCFTNDDVQGIGNYLIRIVTNVSSIMNYDRNFYKQFLPEEISMAYKTILKELGI